MASSLQQPSIGQESFQESFGPESFASASGKIAGMYQGGRSRNFRIAQGLQFVATQRQVSLQPGAFSAGETDAVPVSQPARPDIQARRYLPSLAAADG